MQQLSLIPEANLHSDIENRTKYTYEEAMEKSLEYFNGDELAASVFVGKYALNDGKGNYYELTPDDMHKRLAKEFARIEAKYPNAMSEEEIYELLKEFEYIVPQGSPMSAIGNPFHIQTLGNCYVLEPPFDSYGGIYKADQELAQLMKRRAGVGLSLDNIRPKGLHTNNAAKTTDGIAGFMEQFSDTCRRVAQSGRRGAEMQMLSVHHLEIETFINMKKDKKKVTGANISIKLTDEFMKALQNDEEYEQRWPIDSGNPKVTKRVKAKYIWDQIIDAAWSSAEPGIFFIDNQIKYTPADVYAKINKDWLSTCTNPCGEIGMGVDSCRLLLINLFSFVENPFEKDSYFDFDKFAEIIIKAQRLMDDIVDLELECMDKIIFKIESDPEPNNIKIIELDLWKRLKKNCIDGRRTGLGITGLGDTLAALNVRYGSKDSIEWTELIYKDLAINAYKSTCIMAKERGPFPLFNHEIEKNHPFINRILDASGEVADLYYEYGRRNIALTTTAPAGSVSTLTQTTSGIEPAYLLKYDRFKKVNPGDTNIRVDRVDDVGDSWQKYNVYHHNFKKWMEITGKDKIEDSPYYKAISNDIDWVAGVKLQAVAQKWVCHSISRTANIPKDSTKELVSEIYQMAWREGCKGYTVYRDGCRDGVLVASSEDNQDKPEITLHKNAPKRPSTLDSQTHKIKVDFGDGTPRNAYITVSFFPDTKIPYEIFVISPQSGLDEKDLQILELAARSTSMNLRHGVPLQYICEQLDKIGGQYIFSIPISIAKVLRKYIPNQLELPLNKEKTNGKSLEKIASLVDILPTVSSSTDEILGLSKCPKCRQRTYVLEGGCGQCHDPSCNYTSC